MQAIVRYLKTAVEKKNTVALVLISAVILSAMLVIPPQRYGDGNEYFLMLESLSNHLSPDLRESDIDDFYDGPLNAFGESITPYGGYYQSPSGSFYSYHFWAYPLTAVPAKTLLEFLSLDARMAFQVTNAVLFALLLAFITFLSKLTENQKFVLILLLAFSPALWFIHWTHPEIFSFVFVTIALLLMDSKRYGPAVISASVASLQNQMLALLVLFMVAEGTLSSKRRANDFLKLSLLSLLVLIPNLFYFINFGDFSLLAGTTSPENASLLRVFEMLFDLNVGLLPYIPVTLILFFCIISLKTLGGRKLTRELSLLIVMLSMMAVCSATYNWNHGTSGPLRYSIWMLPVISFVIAKNLELIMKSRVLRYALFAGILSQLLIVLSAGAFVTPYPDNYVHHTLPAKFMLDNLPALYNPTPEIFCERTVHAEVDCNQENHYVTVYKNDGICRKALLTCHGIETLEALCGFVDEDVKRLCVLSQNGRWFYVNY